MIPEKKKTTSKKSAAKKPATKKKVAPTKKAAPKKKEATTKSEAPTEQKTKAPMMKIASIRIRLSAFDHVVLDEAVTKIMDASERSGAVMHGPIPLPTKIRKFTVNKSTFKHKTSREQFEMRTHRRLIDLTETTSRTMENLQSLSLPSGVDIEIKMG